MSSISQQPKTAELLVFYVISSYNHRKHNAQCTQAVHLAHRHICIHHPPRKAKTHSPHFPSPRTPHWRPRSHPSETSHQTHSPTPHRQRSYQGY
ncbi:hypothetical protein BDV98DRAFT_569449 [Pterulicium gracile]|uniref:Uncharacterized protein n=1 Tax=Pterulicium gracile TaxID=1884261 RepID=A0A5C3QDV2_9AGAR|nr:hypothetical protein BDV98DRAFT_569449 [Pterula gracilis]